MAGISGTGDSAAHHQDSKKTNADSRSLKQTKKKGKTWSSAKCGPSSANAPGGRTAGVINSNGSMKPGDRDKLPKPKIDLKAFFDYYFVRKQHLKAKKRGLREQSASKRRKKTPKKRRKIRVRQQKRRSDIPALERKRKAKERGLQFPFVEKLCGRKHIPLKLVCRYEQEALQGYFKYIEMLKYEHHLKNSLAKLNAGDDLENESLESRKYKYLDDDGPLSPIEEPTEEDENMNSGSDDIGARIVEKSSFILSSTIPQEKKKSTKESSVLENKRSGIFSIGSQKRRSPSDVVSKMQQ